MSKNIHTILALTACLLIFGCASPFIAGTKIKDTKLNRQALKLIESYRLAVEGRNVAALSTLLSERYYENGSTTDVSTDDYGAPEMRRDVLPMLGNNVTKVIYEIRVNKIVEKDDRALVDYEYVLKFRFTSGEGEDQEERWSLKNDVNQLELVREHGAWKILSGM